MHVIVDYGLGNLNSLMSALERIDFPVVLSGDKEVISQAKSIILPGVGAFADAMNALNQTGLTPLLKSRANDGIPFMGICLGMQLLFEKSEEDGLHDGLGLIPGIVRRIPDSVKVPHMGWNRLQINREDPVLKYMKPNEYVYYVHSYYADCPIEFVVASSEYGVEIPGIVRREQIYGMQFHPEKSSEVGTRLLQAYKELICYDSISCD